MARWLIHLLFEAVIVLVIGIFELAQIRRWAANALAPPFGR